mgnify:CR=1 FL=1
MRGGIPSEDWVPVKTDLGDAMTEITAVNLDRARAEFEWMMTQARLAAMRGQLLVEEQTE